jgi:hypothetical protein
MRRRDEIRGRTGEEDDLCAAMYCLTCSVTMLQGLESDGAARRGCLQCWYNCYIVDN